MADKKTPKKEPKKKVELKITVKDLPEELDDSELEQVAGGILASPTFQKTFAATAMSKTSLLNAADSGHCDCWSYTACGGNLGGSVIR